MPSVRQVEVGSELPPLVRVVTAEDVKAYAEAGGDKNPLHQDDAVARAAGFPGIIAHGMFTMGHLAACVARWAGGPERVRRLTSQFRASVYMGEEIVAHGRIRSIDADRGTAIVDCWVTLERDGRTESPIKRGEAEVQLDP
jgi:acyl dehydratase